MEMTEYHEGQPSWTDLATPDLDAAMAFYGSLFGWEFVVGDAAVGSYTMATKKSRNVAGMLPLSAEMAAGGMPPTWTCYVLVDDIEASVAKVPDAGGIVMQPPMDVVDAGRMSIVADPSGAVFCLWEAKKHRGADLMGEHGSMVWMELTTPDPAAVAPFYAQVLGWTCKDMGPDMGGYQVFDTASGVGDGVAGAMAPQAEGMPNYWGVYFAVDDCDVSAALAVELGATLLVEPMDIPTVGRFSVILDPQGAAFSILQPLA